MNLSSKQKKHLRGLAHSLKPIVTVGNKGITEGVIAELNESLTKHELLKLKISAPDKQQLKEMLNEITLQSGCEVVQTIGHIAVLYRPASPPVIEI